MGLPLADHISGTSASLVKVFWLVAYSKRMLAICPVFRHIKQMIGASPIACFCLFFSNTAVLDLSMPPTQPTILDNISCRGHGTLSLRNICLGFSHAWPFYSHCTPPPRCSLLHVSSWDFSILVPSLGFFICHRWNLLTRGIPPHLRIFYALLDFAMLQGHYGEGISQTNDAINISNYTGSNG